MKGPLMEKQKKRKQEFGTANLAGYLMISPWLVGLLIFTVYPLLSSLYFSFTSYDLLTEPTFAGLSNYKAAFADERFFQSMKVTFTYALVHVPLKLAFALAVAMLFNTKRKGVGVYRTLYYIPSIVGGSIAISVMWIQMFGTNGAFNSLVSNLLSIDVSTNWIKNPDTSLATIIILAVWQFGSPMLIFLAGLKQIPRTYYEAAQIDGAGPISRFFRITLPSLTPIIFFNLIMQVISAFMAFTQAFIISGGAGSPSDTTLFYALYIYLQGLKYNQMGYACALAWIMIVLISVITAIIFKTSNAWVFYAEEE